MNDSMFQKQVNDQIGVSDIDIINPAPELLDEHYPTPATKVGVGKIKTSMKANSSSVVWKVREEARLVSCSQRFIQSS